MKLFISLFFVLFSFSAVADDVVYENPNFFKQPAEKPTVKICRGIPKEAETEIGHNTQIYQQDIAEKPKLQTECDKQNAVCLNSYIYKDKIVLEAYNKASTAYSMVIKFFLNNMVLQNHSDTKIIILQPDEKKTIDVLDIIDPTSSYGYNYNFTSYFGIIDAKHDDNFVYDLPFDVDKEFMLMQGVGGRFSHSSQDQYYSYDFKMPTSTPVLAARDGVVVKIVQSFSEGGVNTSLKNKANYLYIQHDDGTLATYAHLKYNGALVNVGDKVQKGQKIALSGNTGYTTNPHLHFGVFKIVRGGKFVSVPVKIKTSEGVFEKLKPGEIFKKNIEVGGTKKEQPKTQEVRPDNTNLKKQ